MAKRSLVQGALILTIANIITRLIGFFYKIYMSNVIGSVGMGIYQLIMPLYMLVWSLSSSGFSTTISKLVAEENSKKQYGNSRKILHLCIYLSLLISIFLSFIVYFFSDYIGTTILNEERTILSIKIMAFSFPFMAVGSCIRGYFFGIQDSLIPAISQVLEQIIRMVVIYILAGSFISKGIEFACGMAVIGMCAGEIISFLYVYLYYKWFKFKNNFKNKSTLSNFNAYSIILSMSIPLTCNKVTGSLLSTIENILIPQRLELFGYSKTASMAIFGKLSGMAMPLIMFPSSLLMALSISIIPVIAESVAKKDFSSINSIISKCILFSLIIGIGTMGGFFFFSNEISSIVYKNQDIGYYLALLTLVCPFLYCQVTLSGILNGLGEQFFIFKNSLVSSIINISFIYFLVPKFEIKAFILGWVISLLVVNITSILKISKKINFKIDLYNSITKPIICIIFSCVSSKYVHWQLSNIFNNITSTLLSLIILIAIYLSLLFISKCISYKDINLKK